MILVKNTFQVKYGQAKPAIAALKEVVALTQGLGMTGATRILSDLTGPAYTLVLEVQYEGLAAFEEERKVLSKPEWRPKYEAFAALVASGGREIYNIVE